MRKKTIKDLDDAQVRGKRALVRVDFNVPLDDQGRITDDTRIRASLPTIELLLERDCRPVILSHLGRPKGKPEAKYSLQPVARRLQELAGCNVLFVESTDSDEAYKASHSLKNGELLLLENTRFLGGEEKNDQRLSRALAELGDFFVNDAFKKAASSGPLEGILRYSEEELVSSDFIGDPASCILDSKTTNVIDGNLVTVQGWYDNEWGYASRCVDMLRFMGERL